MRNCCLLIFLVFSILSCRQKQDAVGQAAETTADTLDELQGEWQMLTEMGDNQWVIYSPCDADNQMIQVHSDTLLIGWGQDASIGLVTSFYRGDDGRVVLTVSDPDRDERATYSFQFDDETRKLARWWLYEDDSSALFAHEDILDNYAAYEQPCSECWDDCEDQD